MFTARFSLIRLSTSAIVVVFVVVVVVFQASWVYLRRAQFIPQ